MNGFCVYRDATINLSSDNGAVFCKECPVHIMKFDILSTVNMIVLHFIFLSDIEIA